MTAPDGHTLVVLATLAVGVTAALVALPRAATRGVGGWATAATAAATALVALARDPITLGLAWAASFAPLYAASPARRDPEARRATTTLAVGSTAPMLLAMAALVARGAGWSEGFAGAARRAPHATQELVALLLAVSALARCGAFPFHSWLPVMAERGPAGPVAAMVSAPVGLLVLTRVLPEVAPDAGPQLVTALRFVGLAGALYGGVLSLAQRDLRRGVGFIAVGQTGLALAGLGSGAAAGVAGAALYSAGASVTTVGLLAVSHAVGARAGTTSISRLGGLVTMGPRMAAAFLLLGAVAIGVPGSAGFAGEDLLVHGLMETHPAAALLLIGATLLLAAGFFSLYARAFLGPALRDASGAARGVPDLLPRERLTAFALAALVIAAGLAPGWLLGAVGPEAERAAHLGHAAGR
ncbi:MAG: proton-conducting transporter membrane subunit [Polyangiales bacterium]